MKLIDLARSTDHAEDIADFMRDFCERLELDHAAYAGSNPVSGQIHGFVNYPEPWKAHYQEEGLAQVDPTLWAASRSIAPVDWTRLPRDESFERVFSQAHDFGITDNGLTVPVRGPYGDVGLLSVTRATSPEAWARQVPEIVSQLQGLAVHLHDQVMGTDGLSRKLRLPQLSKREREVLQWIAAGKTQMDVGDILSISERTVEVHLRSAREKLQALTTAQAVARAIGQGVIYPL